MRKREATYAPGNTYGISDRREVERIVRVRVRCLGRQLCSDDLHQIADDACDRLGKCGPWRAVGHAIGDWLRAVKREPLLGDRDVMVLQSDEVPPLPKCYVRLVRNERHRLLVVALSEGMSLNESAEAIGVSPSTAHSWLRSIRADLRFLDPNRSEPLTIPLQNCIRANRVGA